MKEPMPGYLSLHQTSTTLIIKWTPNELMNGYVDDNIDKRSIELGNWNSMRFSLNSPTEVEFLFVLVNTGITH